MENDIKIMSDERLAAVMDRWQVAMPDQQFFVNLPAVVQLGSAKRTKHWWVPVFAPMPVTSFVMLFLLTFGFVTIRSQLASEKKLSQTAASWVSEGYGWSNIDKALEVMAEGIPETQRDAKYLSTLHQGTYLYGDDNASQMMDDLTETEMEYLLAQMQNTRS